MTNSSIRKGLLQFVFSGAYMKRWNDKLRPMELIEIDKQAHKMIVAWLLCQLAVRGKSPEDRLQLEEAVVEGGLFDYMFRLVITDIKPPILYRIKENPAHYQQLAKWGIREVQPYLRPLGEAFWQRFEAYVMDPKPVGEAARILGAAHLYASVWEFHLLKGMNQAFDDEMKDIEIKYDMQLQEYADIAGMPEFIAGLNRLKHQGQPGQEMPAISALARFANLCGQLRFQKRWSQTPRIPESSVMGHMFIVACFSYFVSLTVGACPARRVNNFHCGLFHDLPELLTRDIISPVKKSFEGLDLLIKEYEQSELERRVFRGFEQEGHKDITTRLRYYLGLETGSEFHDTYMQAGRAVRIDFATLQEKCNEDRFDPKDGEAIKCCDVLAAYIEAYTAMRNGIASDQIQQAFWRLREQYSKYMLGSLHVGALFTDFD